MRLAFPLSLQRELESMRLASPLSVQRELESLWLALPDLWRGRNRACSRYEQTSHKLGKPDQLAVWSWGRSKIQIRNVFLQSVN